MLEIGNFLSDRYEILSKIGAGGMSDVYKAKDHILNWVVFWISKINWIL